MGSKACKLMEENKMVKLSEHDIDEIIDLARHTWHTNKDFRGEYRKEYFMRDLKLLLNCKSSGVKENVCSQCLGTGYKP
jgi:hypothetical protein